MTPRREPAWYVGVLAPVLALLVALNVGGLTSDQAALIVAAITAVGGAILALATRPIAPGLFTAAVGAVAALFAGFGFHADPGVVAAVSGVLTALVAFISRHQVTPVASSALTRR
jgi:hypothetical protein